MMKQPTNIPRNTHLKSITFSSFPVTVRQNNGRSNRCNNQQTHKEEQNMMSQLRSSRHLTLCKEVCLLYLLHAENGRRYEQVKVWNLTRSKYRNYFIQQLPQCTLLNLFHPKSAGKKPYQLNKHKQGQTGLLFKNADFPLYISTCKIEEPPYSENTVFIHY